MPNPLGIVGNQTCSELTRRTPSPPVRQKQRKRVGVCVLVWPSGGQPSRRTAENFALFLLCFSLFWGSSRCFVAEGRGQNVCLGSLWSSPTTLGRRGLTRKPRNPNVYIRGPQRFEHHQNSTRRPPEKERLKKENCGGRVKKKREILGSPPSFGAHRVPPFRVPPTPTTTHFFASHVFCPVCHFFILSRMFFCPVCVFFVPIAFAHFVRFPIFLSRGFFVPTPPFTPFS